VRQRRLRRRQECLTSIPVQAVLDAVVELLPRRARGVILLAALGVAGNGNAAITPIR
jgi:hypothetical protein